MGPGVRVGRGARAGRGGSTRRPVAGRGERAREDRRLPPLHRPGGPAEGPPRR